MSRPIPICPCCGQPIQLEGLLVDVKASAIEYAGKRVSLKPSLIGAAEVLVASYPRPVSSVRIVERMRPRSRATKPSNLGKVYVYHLRRALEPLGVSIDTMRSGYVLRYKGDAR